MAHDESLPPSAGATTPVTSRHRAVPRLRALRLLRNLVSYAVLVAGSAAFLLPLLWMVSTSLKEPAQIYSFPIEWIPSPIAWENYVKLFTDAPFLRYIGNTIFITVVGVIGNLLGSSIAAYAFARLRFRGRDVMFYTMLATMMVPGWATLIPSFVMFSWIGWLDSYLPFLVPAFFAVPFNTFLLRQFFLSIPVEMEESALIDGAGRVRIFLEIVVPLAKPALVMSAIFSFLAYWNEFLGPLVYVQSQDKFPLSVGLQNFASEHTQNYGLMMAGALIALLPCVVLFLAAQRWFIQGVVVTGVKG
ncbi:carbohydrate ABC transporter permease [Jiangella alba]|uniref:carbohydrate ABC transporter permease n=1 Tax=Jiangella alba TaxID=561176 RepID=UPI001C0B7A47|nr:carbohydrate ABC transporter permease [Jiangella alba]